MEGQPSDANSIALLTQRVGQNERDVQQKFDALSGQMSALSAQFQQFMSSRQPRLNVWIPSIATVLVGFWFVLNLQVTSSQKGFSDSLARLEAIVATNVRVAENIPTLMSQNADSKRDREDMNKKLDYLGQKQADLIATQAKETAERLANEREVETQIDAQSQALSIQFASQQRLNSDYQNALHDQGARMPTAPTAPFFFPNISNRNHRKQ